MPEVPRKSNLAFIPIPLIHKVYNPQNQDRGGEGPGPCLGTRIVKRAKDRGLVFAILILLLRYEVAFMNVTQRRSGHTNRHLQG